MRALRLILGETLIELGAALRLIGWRLVPDHHPTVTSNGDGPLTLSGGYIPETRLADRIRYGIDP